MSRQPTVLQIKTLQGMAQGKSMHRAMLDAGYSVQTAKKGMTVFRDPRFKLQIFSVKEELRKMGITPTKIAKKFTELMDAQKTIVVDKEAIDVPDNSIQLGATKAVNNIWNDNDSLHPRPRRRITFEEFAGINDDES